MSLYLQQLLPMSLLQRRVYLTTQARPSGRSPDAAVLRSDPGFWLQILSVQCSGCQPQRREPNAMPQRGDVRQCTVRTIHLLIVDIYLVKSPLKHIVFFHTCI